MNVSFFAGIDGLAVELDGLDLGVFATQDAFDDSLANDKASFFIAGFIERRIDLGDFDHRGLLRCKKEAARCPRRPECVLIIDCAAIGYWQRECPKATPMQG